MAFSNSPAINYNGFFNSTSLPYLRMIQRRQDPNNATASRDVFGIVDSTAIYRIVADNNLNTLNVTEKIPITQLGVFLDYGQIDVGLYNLVVYSGANCNAVSGTTQITQTSAWFYTFSNKTWSCMDLNNPTTKDVFAWNVTI